MKVVNTKYIALLFSLSAHIAIVSIPIGDVPVNLEHRTNEGFRIRFIQADTIESIRKDTGIPAIAGKEKKILKSIENDLQSHNILAATQDGIVYDVLSAKPAEHAPPVNEEGVSLAELSIMSSDAGEGAKSAGDPSEGAISLSSMNNSGMEVTGLLSSEEYGTTEQGAGSSAYGGVSAQETPLPSESGSSGFGMSIEGFINHLESIKWYPYLARRKSIEGTVLLKLRLDKYGELVGVDIKESSGHAILDDAAVSLLKRACPFRHGMEKDIAIEVPVTYALIK